MYACARARACVRVRARVRASVQACVGERGRVHGGGRASIGVRACLRFERVLNLPLGAREGGFQGRLFAGNDMIAKRGQRAFKRVFCALGERIGKRGAKGWKGAGLLGCKRKKETPFSGSLLFRLGA